MILKPEGEGNGATTRQSMKLKKLTKAETVHFQSASWTLGFIQSKLLRDRLRMYDELKILARKRKEERKHQQSQNALLAPPALAVCPRATRLAPVSTGPRATRSAP